MPRRLSLDEDVRAKEGGKETTGKGASPAVCTLPMVPCGSSQVTSVSRSPLPSLPRSRFLDVTQRSPKSSKSSFGGALRDIQKTAARETSLYHAKNEAPEEEADFRPCDVNPRREPMTSWAPAHVQTLSQPHASSRGRELTRDILGTSLPLVST